MRRDVVAREWLICLGALGAGLTVWPILFRVFQPNMQLGLFYGALVGGEEQGLAWLFVAVPYAIIQLGRSIWWAIKNARQAK